MYAIYLESGDDSLSLFGIRRSKHGGSKGEVCTTAFFYLGSNLLRRKVLS